MSRILVATGAALLLATSMLAGPASATEHKSAVTQSAATVSVKSPAASIDLSARRYHRYYRHYGYRRPYYRYGYRRPYPYYAYAPGPYYRPYYRPFPFGFFPFY